ncbi:MAG: Rrf2 family transcriptional regulator [Candidatus Omnitrophica bacterium]|nr:Rrf2 family transcriptional regulator [Candidatus Omnitrophota bacterium]
MMRLSTKSRYGARLMIDLASHYGKGNILLKDIARRQEISVGYLEHLLPPLKAAGLVTSGRGAHGGYALAKSPSKINLKDIVETMEGSLAPVRCVDNPALCHRTNYCITIDVWKELKENITRTLESITLQDLLGRRKEKLETSLIYNI